MMKNFISTAIKGSSSRSNKKLSRLRQKLTLASRSTDQGMGETDIDDDIEADDTNVSVFFFLFFLPNYFLEQP